MTDETPIPDPSPRVPRPPERRSRKSRRAYVNIPGLARRGRATLRQVIALLFGGFVSSVEVSRSRGGRGFLFRLRAMSAWIIRIFLNKKIVSQPFPVQLRMRLEILGPTYVKLGQILSLRQDILPDIVTSELRNLLSDLPPVSYEEIHAIVEADLGRPVDEIFAEVDEMPLGSASIAQSHWARLASR
jgi:ubiquinone biosynthesis protein